MMPERLAVSVSELNEYARRLMAADPLLRNLEVTGEISGWKDHVSGHKYFAMKDDHARVQCVMFRQNALTLSFRPSDGMRVTVKASASIFERDGSFQLYVTEMRKDGEGELFLRFEQLKRALMAEGLFDPARKREIPFFPKVIGVVTSRTGAVIRDILHVVRRRNPNVGVLLAPCSVQGPAAAGEIVDAIARLNDTGIPDVLLVGRGGGSIEDLWPFNEEIVARAIAASRIPVISCVGHETDFTIADFVADLRAPTPSAAAELAVPVLKDLQERLDALTWRLTGALHAGQQLRRARLEKLSASAALSMPQKILLDERRARINELSARLAAGMEAKRIAARRRLEGETTALRTLNPNRVLERGYAIVERQDCIVSDAEMLSPGENIRIKMRGGQIGARVTEAADGHREHDV